MLVLKFQGEIIENIVEGSTFALPNGDYVSPACSGWSDANGYSLEELPPPPEMSAEDMLNLERETMELTFAQLLIGLVSEGWITVEEGELWLTGILPALAENFIAALPVQYRFVARARLIRPSTILRLDSSTLGLAMSVGKTDAEIDTFFRTYRNV